MFKRAADGIAKKGKTEGKNYGDTGPTVGMHKGPKKGKSVTNEALMKFGRGMAKVKNQGA